MEKIIKICESLADIEMRMDNGELPFECDNLHSAMKLGHPVEILDEIIAPCYYDVMGGKKPTLAKVKKMHKQLKTFQRAFKVNISTIIREIAEYIAQEEAVTEKGDEG